MLARIRNVLRYLGQKIQRIDDLKIAFRTRQQILAGSFREASEPVVCGLVEDFALTGDLDHSRLAEWTTQEIFDQPLEARGVSRVIG